MNKVLAGIVRHVLTAAGGALVAKGTIADSDLQAVIGAVVTIVGVVASVIAKRTDDANSVKPR